MEVAVRVLPAQTAGGCRGDQGGPPRGTGCAFVAGRGGAPDEVAFRRRFRDGQSHCQRIEAQGQAGAGVPEKHDRIAARGGAPVTRGRGRADGRDQPGGGAARGPGDPGRPREGAETGAARARPAPRGRRRRCGSKPATTGPSSPTGGPTRRCRRTSRPTRSPWSGRSRCWTGSRGAGGAAEAGRAQAVRGRCAGGRGCRRSGLARGARPGHAVADAAHVEDPGRVRRVVAELLAELLDEGAHDLGVAVAPPGPDPVQQRLGGRDPSGVDREDAQQLVVPPIYLIRGASRTPTGPPALVMAPSSL